MSIEDALSPFQLTIPSFFQHLFTRVEYTPEVQAQIQLMQAEHSKMIDAIWELVLSSATKITGMEDKLRNMLELNPNQAMQYQNDYALVADGEALDGPALEAARALQTLRTAFLMGNAIFYRLAGEVNKSQGEVGKAISAWLTAKGIPETESYGVLGAYLVYFGSANGEVSA